MDPFERTPEEPVALSLSPRERVLLKRLVDHSCGEYLVRVLEGFIHNLNNPLQILCVRSEQLQKDISRVQEAFRFEPSAETTEFAKSMESRIDSLAKSLDELSAGIRFLSKDFLFERRSKISDVRINEVIEDTIFLLNADAFFKHGVKKTLRLDDSLPVLAGRHTDFCIIMTNLIQNALEAMADAQEKHLSIETYRENTSIAIKVRDTGCGIPEEKRQDIHKAFLTTKSDSGQECKTGIGLCLVSLLLEDYRGHIDFESTSGNTTFVVHLPCQP